MDNIPEGYKQTEVGVIPVEWEVFEFGQLVDYTKGFPFKSKDYKTDGIRIIRVSDTTFDSIKEENQIYIDDISSNQYQKWKLEEDDLIFSTVGSKPPMYDSMVGKVIIVEKKYEGSLLNQNAVLIRAKIKTKYKQQILLNHFRTKRFLRYIESIFRGNANQASITLEDLFQFQIPLPKLEKEQQAIASALSDVDALITALEQLITKKRNIKQGAMQQLLTGKKRLPGFSGEWEVKKLGEIAEMYSGGTPNTSVAAYYKGKIPWVVIADMTKAGKYIYETEKKISDDGIKNSSAKLFNKGTLLFAMYASIGKCSIAKIDLTCNQAILGIKPIKIDTEFLYYFLFMNEETFGTIGQTGTQKNLNKEMVQAISIPYPQVKEQQAIAQILSDMDTEIEALEQKRDKYKALKQGMMQELLTGKTRLV